MVDDFCGIYPLVVYHINIDVRITFSHDKFYLVNRCHLLQSCGPSTGIKIRGVKNTIKIFYSDQQMHNICIYIY